MPKKIFPFIIICLSFIGCQNKTAEQDNDINWAKGAVWYQIFPERFRNGDPANDPTVAEVPETENPQSWIWTKADSAFLRLIKEAHLRDIKIVIDGVFNHSGLDFFAFKDIVQNGKESRYVDWYTITAWDDASEWITDKRMDNTMNYLFSKVVVDFFIDQKTAISAIKFSDRLQEIIALYGNETSLLLWNLIDSHDTDRLASMIINPDRDYDRNGGLRDNPDYLVRKPNNDEIKILKQIVAFQMTFIGAPVIYYGDEAGMWGADDPCDRKPMLWGRFGL